jgi:hypothetical protein
MERVRPKRRKGEHFTAEERETIKVGFLAGRSSLKVAGEMRATQRSIRFYFALLRAEGEVPGRVRPSRKGIEPPAVEEDKPAKRYTREDRFYKSNFEL